MKVYPWRSSSAWLWTNSEKAGTRKGFQTWRIWRNTISRTKEHRIGLSYQKLLHPSFKRNGTRMRKKSLLRLLRKTSKEPLHVVKGRSLRSINKSCSSLCSWNTQFIEGVVPTKQCLQTSLISGMKGSSRLLSKKALSMERITYQIYHMSFSLSTVRR